MKDGTEKPYEQIAHIPAPNEQVRRRYEQYGDAHYARGPQDDLAFEFHVARVVLIVASQFYSLVPILFLCISGSRRYRSFSRADAGYAR
jgi:hypothetical protein